MELKNLHGRLRQRRAFQAKEIRTEALSCEFWEETAFEGGGVVGNENRQDSRSKPMEGFAC